MIDYEPRQWWRLLFQLRGSVLPGLVARMTLVAACGLAAAWLYQRGGTRIAPITHTILGVALGLLLVFRTNASYDRYWEGRRLLGSITNRCRDLARQLVAFVAGGETDRARIARLLSATYALVRQHLRRERDLGALGDLLTAEERAALESVSCRPTYTAAWITRALAEAANAGRLSEQRLQAMDANVTAIVDAWGGCERILKTPIPFAYAQHIKSFLVLFCVTVPFAMVEAMGWYTPLAAAILTYALFGIDEIGVEIEDPFGYDPNDLPLERIGETIAGDVGAMMRA